MANSQLGTDIKLTNLLNNESEVGIASTAGGDLATINDIENVRQALYMRLSTPLGDLWAHPDYGNAAHDIVGDVMDENFVIRVTDAFRDCVNAEPRVDLISITSEISVEERTIIFSISYKIRNDPRQDNLVYPYKVGDNLV